MTEKITEAKMAEENDHTNEEIYELFRRLKNFSL